MFDPTSMHPLNPVPPPTGQPTRGPLPFPVEAARRIQPSRRIAQAARCGSRWSLPDRRMLAMARQLGCLGHFDSGDLDPSAA